MMKKFYLSICLLCSILASCNKENVDNTESFSLNFYPREVSNTWISPGIKVKNAFTIDGEQITAYDFRQSESDQFSANELFLSICTSNEAPRKGQFIVAGGDDSKGEHIPALERQIETDYRDMPTRANVVTMEYRTNGVKAITITADKTLFGVPAGSSLNDYLTIAKYEPDYICGTNLQVLYGKGDQNKPTEIASWLQLKPLAQPNMFLSLSSIPEELPQEVCFSVTLITDKDNTLTYTTKPIRIIK